LDTQDNKLSIKPVRKAKNHTKNCLFCRFFNVCTNQDKSYSKICDNFKTYKAEKVKKTNKEKPLDTSEFKSFDDSKDVSIFIKQIDTALKSFEKSPLPQDLKIDDRDLPRAKNFVEFCGPNFLNVTPFAKQYEHAIKILAEYCPRCSNTQYLKDIPIEDSVFNIQDNIVCLENGVCPKCSVTKSELFVKNELKVPVQVAGVAGQRSGKTALSRMIAVYGYHNLLKLPNGAATYNVLPSEILYSQLIAITWIQSKELLYDVIYNYLTESPWFVDYNKLMDYYSNKYGEEISRIKDTFAVYRHKRLYIAPYGPDKRKLRGRTGYLSCIDELDWLISAGSSKDEEGKMKINGEEIYTSTENTFGTLVPEYYKQLTNGISDLPTPLLLTTSSPSSKKGIITRLYNESKQSTTIYGYRAATWEFNPNITRKSLDSKFRVNYIKAMRDFGAVPPNSSTPYISKKKYIKNLFEKSRRNAFTTNQVAMIMPNESERTCAKVKFNIPKSSINHCLSIDPGYSGNSFAITTGYYSEELNKPVFDGFCEIIPFDSSIPISFNNVYQEVLCPIVEHMNVKLVVSDRWQNISLLSELQAAFDVYVVTYSPKYKIFEDFKTMTEIDGCVMPNIECKWDEIEKLASEEYPMGFYKKPMAHLVYQLLTVKDLGKDVTKGDDTTDDIFRSLIGCYAHIIDENYRELVTGVDVKSNSKTIWGVVGSSGTGGGKIGTMIVNGIGMGVSRN
jgi:hypothetical protein